MVTCLSLLIFALASFPIVFSQQISYAVKLPQDIGGYLVASIQNLRTGMSLLYRLWQ